MGRSFRSREYLCSVERKRLADMSKQVEAMAFRLLVDAPLAVSHSRFSCEATLNTGLEEHLKTCEECRNIIAKDLRDFADQIERMRK